MKYLYIIFVLFIPGSLFSQKTISKKHDFGKGNITIGFYAHQSTDSLDDENGYLPVKYRNQLIKYSINQNNIFRSIPIDSSQVIAKSLDSNTITVSLINFSYLIKYDSSILYYYAYKKDTLAKLIAYGLDTTTFEYFYSPKWEDSVRLKLLPLQENEQYLINNIPCYKGDAIELQTGYKVSFFYTKQKMKVRSPLNCYFNYSFPYEIVRIKFYTNWTDKTGAVKPKGANVIFQIENYDEKVPEDKCFELPKSVPIVYNIPISDVLRNINK